MEERRLSPRLIDIPVTVHQCVVTHLGKETWLSASAVDFSPKGVCLLLPDSLNSGESIYLLLSVKPADRAARDLEVNGVTSYCRPTEGSQWRVGIQFLDLSDEERADWSAYLGN